MLTKIDECQTASEVVKSVNILIAIRWVAKAWSMVTVQTINECFRRAGILNSEMDIVSCNMEGDDPFLAVDEEADFVSLMNMLYPSPVVLPSMSMERMTYLCATTWDSLT